ncbi:uncharacterized protein FIBRA_04774 [Fibroporia radiculosa]|uniref:Uncharacterized protein n=1 Tax=Fibroporia radiculosa TaxID=599839 RepID=J4H352_9APHY|nr:uncharacterized protein FIBRA_04774 [Fibroporia radiculosa]CCM02669.1 predicted protein [Fibroporia radiculosa]
MHSSPPTLKISRADAKLPESTPYLMPFHIAYSGPAPISTYFRVKSAPPPNYGQELPLLQNANVSSLPEGDSQTSDPLQSTLVSTSPSMTLVSADSGSSTKNMEVEELNGAGSHTSPPKRYVASFRGRTLQGLQVYLPEGYSGLVLQASGGGDEKPSLMTGPRGGDAPVSRRTTRRSGKTISPEAQGSVVEKDGCCTVGTEETEVADDSEGQIRVLQPISTFSSFVLWNPDTCVDEGKDEYLRALTEWTQLAAEYLPSPRSPLPDSRTKTRRSLPSPLFFSRLQTQSEISSRALLVHKQPYSPKMVSLVYLAALIVPFALVHADPTPTTPSPGAVYDEGAACEVGWDADPQGIWTVMNIELMTGSNTDMQYLTTVGTVDGTNAANNTYSYPCPNVDPNSQIYFYQFTSPYSSSVYWTGRFAIASPSGQTTPPTESTVSNGQTIYWGTGTIVGQSGSATPPAYGGSTTGASNYSTPSAPPVTSANLTTFSVGVNSTTISTSVTANETSSSATTTASSTPSSTTSALTTTTTSSAAPGNTAATTSAGGAAANAAPGALKVDNHVVRAAVGLAVAALTFTAAL